jgi:hypothetical protein
VELHDEFGSMLILRGDCGKGAVEGGGERDMNIAGMNRKSCIALSRLEREGC